MDVRGGRVGLGSLEGHAEGSVPDELGDDSERPRDSEEDGVEVLVGEAVVGEEDTRVGVHVGPRVLGLARLEEDVGHELVQLADELEQLVVRQVLERELSLGLVSGVRLSEDGVSVTRDDLASVERLPDVLGHLVVRRVLANLLLHSGDPVEDLLVGESVQRSGETVEGGGHREERVRERGSDEVSGVGRDVSSLVVRVDGQVQSHELDKLLVPSKAEEGGQVLRVVGLGVDRGELVAAVRVSVDSAGDVGQLGDQVHRVVKRGLPVLLLVDPVLVRLREGRVVVEGGDSERELGHGVEGGRARVDEVLDKLGDRSSGGPVGGERGALLLGGDLSGEEEPEESLGEGLVASGRLGEQLLALGDRLSSESDTLVCRDGKEGDGAGGQLVMGTDREESGSACLPASRTDPKHREEQEQRQSAAHAVLILSAVLLTLPDHSLKADGERSRCQLVDFARRSAG